MSNDYATDTPVAAEVDGNPVYYTTFSGADVVLRVDGEAFGEASSIRWTESADGTLFGAIVFTLFDATSIQNLRKNFLHRDEPLDYIHIEFANEYGQRMDYKIHEPEFTHSDGGISMDDIVLQDKVYFSAKYLEVIAPELERASKDEEDA